MYVLVLARKLDKHYAITPLSTNENEKKKKLLPIDYEVKMTYIYTVGLRQRL